MEISNILEAIDLKIGYPLGKKKDKIVLDRINLQLKKGELVCLLGENGVGKSTLLKTFSRVLRPLSGKVHINGTAIDQFSPKELAKKISLVLTENISAGMMEVFEIVALGRYPFTNWGGTLTNDDVQKIDQALILTKTRHLVNEKVSELSDGQLQKVMIARALAQDSDIMILDEPTAFLDISNRIEIMHLLKKLATETNKAILISTHDVELAFQTADRLWLATCCFPILTGFTEDMILNGKIEFTFDNGNFTFDKENGKFRCNNELTAYVNLEGSGRAYYWTKNALEKIGIGIDQKKAKAKIIIRDIDHNKYEWVLTDREERNVFGCIEALVIKVKYLVDNFNA